ncbi:MAG: glycosyltransferase family 39 protein [Synergistaceae bacterium]|nr:glycosyltransferase family 39 protein [Synergistaceae bacterium]
MIFSLYGKPGFISPDTGSYAAPASELAKYGTFSANGTPEIVRTPGYPLFLAMFIELPQWELWAVTAQCFIAGLVTVLTYKLAKSLAGIRAGCFAAFIFAVSPITVTYTTFIITERLTSFFMAVLCAAMFKFLEKPRMAPNVLAAAASSCGAFVRPAAMFVPYCVAAFIIFSCAAKKIRAARIAAFVVVFLLISAAPIRLWEYRNLRVSDYRGFSAISAVNLYFYNAAGVLAKLENKSFYDMQNEMGYYDSDNYKAKHPGQQGLSRGEIFNSMAREGREIIKSNPYIYAKVHIQGMLFAVITPGTHTLVRRSWGENAPGFRSMKHGRSMTSFIMVLIKEMPITFMIFSSSATLLAIVYLFSAAGFMVCGRTRQFETAFVTLTAAYFILIAGGPAATDRFRDPINFIIAMWAGIGIERFLTHKKQWRQMMNTFQCILFSKKLA